VADVFAPVVDGADSSAVDGVVSGSSTVLVGGTVVVAAGPASPTSSVEPSPTAGFRVGSVVGGSGTVAGGVAGVDVGGAVVAGVVVGVGGAVVVVVGLVVDVVGPGHVGRLMPPPGPGTSFGSVVSLSPTGFRFPWTGTVDDVAVESNGSLVLVVSAATVSPSAMAAAGAMMMGAETATSPATAVVAMRAGSQRRCMGGCSLVAACPDRRYRMVGEVEPSSGAFVRSIVVTESFYSTTPRLRQGWNHPNSASGRRSPRDMRPGQHRVTRGDHR
jgi:hypothetical protein